MLKMDKIEEINEADCVFAISESPVKRKRLRNDKSCIGTAR